MTQSVGNFPFPRSSFEWPVTPPDSEADEGAIAVVCFSYAWLPYVLGALKQLLLQSTWEGDDDTVELALGRATDLIAQFDSPSASCPEIMVLRGVRYNPDTDTVQTDFGGTGTWVDAPALDPRHSETMMFPPLTTDDPRCDAAANMRVNLKSFVDAGIRYAELATLTASLIDALLLFIPGIPTILEIVLAGAAALLTAGADALTDDFTTDVYDGIQCIFYCHASGTGVITPDQLENIRADIQAQYPGVVYDVCLAYLLITGEVGLTNAGASGSETGDCSSCDCGWEACIAGTDLASVFTIVGTNGTFTGDGVETVTAFVGGDPTRPRTQAYITVSLDSCAVDRLQCFFDAPDGFDNECGGGFVTSGYWQNNFATSIGFGTGTPTSPFVFAGALTLTDLQVALGVACCDGCGTPANMATITQVKIRGTGTPPSQLTPYLC